MASWMLTERRNMAAASAVCWQNIRFYFSLSDSWRSISPEPLSRLSLAIAAEVLSFGRTDWA